MKRKNSLLAGGVSTVLVLLGAACTANDSPPQSEATAPERETVTLADDYEVTVDSELTGELNLAQGLGLLYAPIDIIRELDVLGKQYPNLEVEWSEIQESSAQRDAMLAGALDAGTSTPAPFLEARDAGVDLKIVQMITAWNGELFVQEDGPDAITDFIGTDWQISPGPSSAQSYAVQSALNQAGEDPHALDNNWVSLPHPDAIQALTTGNLTAEFATSNFVADLRGMDDVKSILNLKDIYDGRMYTTAVVALDETLQEKKDLVAAYAEVLEFATEWMEEHPEQAAEILSDSTNGEVDAEQQSDYLEAGVYAPQSTDGAFRYFAEQLESLGVIETIPADPSEIYAFPDRAGSDW